MGVFLSKPSIEKFSEDGEDSGVQFGVSSMQGWRKHMEDAHVAILDLNNIAQREGSTEGAGRGDHGGQSAADMVRMFGVFDGHGGKEVALFVQEHIAAELVKLEEYRRGDFPSALARLFHRMDDMLEVAASEMRRRKRIASPSAAGSAEAAVGAGRGKDSEISVTSTTGSEEREDAGAEDREDPVAIVFLEELSRFRTTKNPSDMEPRASPGSKITAALMPKASVNPSNDNGGELGLLETEDESDSQSGATGSSTSSELGSSGDGSGRGGGAGAERAERVKMSDALELFARILNMRRDSTNSNNGAAKRLTESFENGSDAGRKGMSSGGGGGGGGGVIIEGEEDDFDLDAIDAAARKPGTGGSVLMSRPAGRHEGLGSGSGNHDTKDEKGEDTFDDEDSEEDEDVLRLANGVANVGMAARPPLALRPNSLAAMLGAGDGPTCQLQDHPIQAGCTSVVCLMVGNTLHVANAGDSRAVMCRGGTALDLSKDHKPMAVTEKSRIEWAGGFVNGAGRVNGNLNLSRSIGDLKYKANGSLPPADQMITAEPDVRSVDVTEADRFVILACDGVWDCMTSQECVDFVGVRVGKMPLSKVCEEVMDACLSEDPRHTAGIGGDNMTCIIVLLNKESASAGVSDEQQGTKEGLQAENGDRNQ